MVYECECDSFYLLIHLFVRFSFILYFTFFLTPNRCTNALRYVRMENLQEMALFFYLERLNMCKLRYSQFHATLVLLSFAKFLDSFYLPLSQLGLGSSLLHFLYVLPQSFHVRFQMWLELKECKNSYRKFKKVKWRNRVKERSEERSLIKINASLPFAIRRLF